MGTAGLPSAIESCGWTLGVRTRTPGLSGCPRSPRPEVLGGEVREGQGGATSDLRGHQGPPFWVHGQLRQGAQAAEQKRGPHCSQLTEGDAPTQPHPPVGALSGHGPTSPRPVLAWRHLGTLGCPSQELTAHTPTGCRGPRPQSPPRLSLADVPMKCFSSVHRGLRHTSLPAPRPVPANSPQGTVHTDEVTESHCGCPGKKWAG